MSFLQHFSHFLNGHLGVLLTLLVLAVLLVRSAAQQVLEQVRCLRADIYRHSKGWELREPD